MNDIKTVSYELKKMILEILEDGKPHDIDDIKSYIKDKKEWSYESYYTKGQMAGCLSQLVSKGEIENVERGVYRKHQKAANAFESSKIRSLDQVRDEIIAMNERYCKDLEEKLKSITAIDLETEEDFEFIKQVKDTLIMFSDLKI